MPTLILIDNKPKKEERRKKIEVLRHQQKRCQIILDKENRVIKTVEHTRKKAKPIEEEVGYGLCKKGEQMEKLRKYDAAIRYYAKGIAQMEESLVNVDNSIERRKRMTTIDGYRHSMQKLKNKNMRFVYIYVWHKS